MADFSSYKLKENYKLCEYIELDNPDGDETKSPYIDTGWKFTKLGETQILIDVAAISDSSGNYFSCGSNNGTSDDDTNGTNFLGIGNNLRWWFNWDTVERTVVPLTVYQRTQFIFKYCPEQDADYWYYKGSRIVQGSVPPPTTEVQQNNFYLFAVSHNSGVKSNFRKGGRIYRFIVIEEGRLVRHMVPVIDSTNTPGMYDLVEGKFYTNANTSATVEFTYKLAHNQLPFGYKECEWIENPIQIPDSTCPYINSTWTFDSNALSHTHITIKTEANNPSGDNWLFGSAYTTVDEEENYDSSHQCIGIYQNKWRPNIAPPTECTIPYTEGVHTIEFKEDNYFYVDGVQLTPYHSSRFQSVPGYIFARHRSDSSQPNENGAHWKVYSFKIAVNDILVRDFVPCLNQNNEPGLYDRVHGVFHGNIRTSSTTTIVPFNYQVKEQVWPSNIRRVGWIQSGCSTTTGKAPYITLQTMELSKYTGFRLRTGVSGQADADLAGKSIMGIYSPESVYYGLFWYPGYTSFRYGNCSVGFNPIVIGSNVTPGFGRTYDIQYNYKFPDTVSASYVEVNTLSKESAETLIRGNKSESYSLYMFTFKPPSFYNTDHQHYIRLYDAEVTQYGNVIHHYVPCIDINQDNKPCVYDTKTNEIFYETPDDNVTEHLTWGY